MTLIVVSSPLRSEAGSSDRRQSPISIAPPTGDARQRRCELVDGQRDSQADRRIGFGDAHLITQDRSDATGSATCSPRSNHGWSRATMRPYGIHVSTSDVVRAGVAAPVRSRRRSERCGVQRKVGVEAGHDDQVTASDMDHAPADGESRLVGANVARFPSDRSSGHGLDSRSPSQFIPARHCAFGDEGDRRLTTAGCRLAAASPLAASGAGAAHVAHRGSWVH